MPAEPYSRFPQPTDIDWIVDTKCGRHMGWPAANEADLRRTLEYYGYTPTFLQPMTEYEAEILAKEQQEDLMHEFRTEIEREMKESA